MRVNVSSENYEGVREIQGWGCDVENCSYGLDAGNSDENHGATESYCEPDCVDGGVGLWVNLGEESRCAVLASGLKRGYKRKLLTWKRVKHHL